MGFWERRWQFTIYMGKPGSSRFRANGKQHSLGLVNSFCSRVDHWDLWASLNSPFPGRGAKHASKETKRSTRGRHSSHPPPIPPLIFLCFSWLQFGIYPIFFFQKSIFLDSYYKFSSTSSLTKIISSLNHENKLDSLYIMYDFI